MKAMHATPKKVRQVFNDSYVIPDFQRPYSWTREQCETLWDDVVGFHATSPANEEQYFLGNIVVTPTDSGQWSVVDGQQRLTTLLLLIKAFFKLAGTYQELEKCLQILDKRTGKLTDELRVKSEVLADDAANLRKIIYNTIEDDNNSNLAMNFRYFVETIDKWRNVPSNSADALLKLIDTFLDKVVLLPIECGSDDDALTIFQTINNRGMSLADTDIFKAKLYHSVQKPEREAFIKSWEKLEDVERWFRVLMHIIRAEHRVTDKEIGLRAFFTADKSKHLTDWRGVMESLRKINAVDYSWSDEDNNDYSRVNSLWAILTTYPNLYWNYPLYVFFHKYGELTDDGDFSLTAKYCDELEQLLIELVKYYFIKGAVHNAVNTVKDTTFKVCAAIAAGKNYKTDFCANIAEDDKTRMATLLTEGRIGERYLRGLVILASYLHPRQQAKMAEFTDILWTKEMVDIEHILPKQWNHYDGWTQKTHEEHLNLLGNLMPLERKINIKAKNEYLRKKKEFYKESVVQDAIDMLSVGDSEWTPQAVKDKHHDKVLRLKTFFGLA